MQILPGLSPTNGETDHSRTHQESQEGPRLRHRSYVPRRAGDARSLVMVLGGRVFLVATEERESDQWSDPEAHELLLLIRIEHPIRKFNSVSQFSQHVPVTAARLAIAHQGLSLELFDVVDDGSSVLEVPAEEFYALPSLAVAAHHEGITPLAGPSDVHELRVLPPTRRGVLDVDHLGRHGSVSFAKRRN